MSDLAVGIKAAVSSKLSPREKILSIEGLIAELPQHEFKVIHHFAPGLYAREIHIPKGYILTGKIHRYAHLNTVSKGEIAVYTEDGPKRIKAPATFMSPPGTKRVGYAIRATVWTTYHPTEETDVDLIEQQVIAPSFESLGLEPRKELE
jgi:hypothetical protein